MENFEINPTLEGGGPWWTTTGGPPRHYGRVELEADGEGAIENLEINPMGHRSLDHGGSRSQCGANTRAGTACQGSRNGNYTHGDWTAEALEERRWVRELRSFGKLEAT